MLPFATHYSGYSVLTTVVVSLTTVDVLLTTVDVLLTTVVTKPCNEMILKEKMGTGIF